MSTKPISVQPTYPDPPLPLNIPPRRTSTPALAEQEIPFRAIQPSSGSLSPLGSPEMAALTFSLSRRDVRLISPDSNRSFIFKSTQQPTPVLSETQYSAKSVSPFSSPDLSRRRSLVGSPRLSTPTDVKTNLSIHSDAFWVDLSFQNSDEMKPFEKKLESRIPDLKDRVKIIYLDTDAKAFSLSIEATLDDFSMICKEICHIFPRLTLRIQSSFEATFKSAANLNS